MKKNLPSRIRSVALIWCLLISANTWAATFNAVTSGLWNNAVTWGGVGAAAEGVSFPGPNDIVNIPASVTVTIPAGFIAKCQSLNLNPLGAVSSSTTNLLELVNASSGLVVSGNPLTASEGLIKINPTAGVGTVSLMVGPGTVSCKALTIENSTVGVGKVDILGGLLKVSLNSNSDSTNNNVLLNGAPERCMINVLQNGNLKIKNSVGGTGKIVHDDTGISTVSGDWALSSTFTIDGLVVLNGDRDQNIDGITSFTNLRLTNSTNGQNIRSVKKLLKPDTLRGTLTISPYVTLQTNNNLIIKSTQGFSGAIAELKPEAIIDGNVKVEVFLTGGLRGWKTMSVPVNGVTYKQLQQYTILTGGTASNRDEFDLGYESNPYFNTVQFYHEPYSTTLLNQYTTISSVSTPTTVGKGFLYYFYGNRQGYKTTKNPQTNDFDVPEDVTVVFEGAINRGAVNVQLTNTNHGEATDGFNLIGNPYPSAIDWLSGTIEKEGILPTTWVLKTDGSYATHTYDFASGQTINLNGGSQYLSTGQGFWVKVKSGSPSGSVTFNEPAKSPADASAVSGTRLLAAPERNSIILDKVVVTGATSPMSNLRLTVKNSQGQSDETFVGFRTSSAALFENDDVNYFSGDKVRLASYSADSKLLAINFMPAISDESNVKLYFSARTAGNYQIQLSDFASLSNYDISLKDNYTNEIFDLKNNNVYSFSANPQIPSSVGGTRFELMVTKTRVLPVKLTAFTAARKLTTVEVKWSTANEVNSDYFQVERSTDGDKFVVISTQKAANTAEGANYNSTDNAPVNGLNYYRLKQVDKDGLINYSDVVAVNFILNGADISISAYPNPAVDELYVKYDRTKSESVSLSIYNMQGQEVKNSNYKNEDVLRQNVSDLTSGLYLLQLKDDTTQSIIGGIKFVKN